MHEPLSLFILNLISAWIGFGGLIFKRFRVSVCFFQEICSPLLGRFFGHPEILLKQAKEQVLFWEMS